MGTRTRSRSSFSKGTLYMQQQDAVTGYTPDPPLSKTVSLVNSETFTDEFPVGKHRPGVFKLTDITRTKVEYSIGTVGITPLPRHMYPTKPKTWGRMWGDHRWFPWMKKTGVSTPIWTLERNTRLLRNAMAKAKSDELGLAETLGEGVQVLKMMSAPLSDMADLLCDCLYRRNGGRRSFSQASSAWLEARYGWTPLYHTLKNMWEYTPLQRGLASKGYKEVTSSSESDTVWLQVSWPSSDIRFTRTLETKETWRCKYYFMILDAYEYNGLRRGGHLFNTPSFLWEFVPLSFVLDWWWDVGNTLKLAMPDPGITTLGWTHSVKCEQHQTVSPGHITTGETGSIEKEGPFGFVGGVSSQTDLYYRRRKNIPDLNVSVPTIDLNFNSWKHAVDSLGLIIQRLPQR